MKDDTIPTAWGQIASATADDAERLGRWLHETYLSIQRGYTIGWDSLMAHQRGYYLAAARRMLDEPPSVLVEAARRWEARP
jgi:hypothetical protein